MPEVGATRACPQCGRMVPQSDSFCGGCGSRMVAAGAQSRTARASLQEVFAHIRAGEQRLATVLMTDISGFTSLGEEAEPEWLFHLINEVFGELVEVLVAHGAHIDKYVGDEVVALFGVPYAQEKAVERALRAALAMRERLRTLNTRGRFAGTCPEIHTGINVGRVMVGPVGHWAHADYTVIGDTVNVAKRLEDEAPPGEIYVTEAVRQAVGEGFEFEAIGDLYLSGRQKTVTGFRLVDAAAGEARSSFRYLPSVGRDNELRKVSKAAEHAAAGEQANLFVLGPIGIGKSHLVNEWTRLEGNTFRQARARCHVFGEHFPLLPVVELAAQLLGLRVESWPPKVAGDVVAALERLPVDAGIRGRLGELLSYLEEPPAEAEEWLAGLGEALAGLLDHAAADQPLCLVLEDVHWIDEMSRAVLTEVLGQPAQRSLLTLLTSREPPDTWPPDSLQAATVVLSPLPRAAMEQLVTGWAGAVSITPEMMRAVCERAQGHPHFARELVHALCRQPDFDAHGELRLPNTLQELFLSQLDALDLPLRQLTQAASVVGEPLSHDLLQAAMREEVELTPGLMGQALSQGLLRMGPASGQFVFGPPLLFETAYGTIPPSARKTLHAALAEHVEQRLETLGAGAVHLAAHHGYLGYGDERALPLLLRSAGLYREQYANRQTVRAAGRVLEIIGSVAEPSLHLEQRLEALLLAAQSYQVLGDLGHAEGTVAEAEILAEPSDNAELAARISTTAATLHLMQGDTAAAMEAFAHAQRSWEKLGNEARVAHALLGRGMCARQLGLSEEAFQLCAEAAQRGAEALWVKAAALNNAGIILMNEGRYREAEPYLVEGLRANEQEGDRRGVAHSRASLGELAFRRAQLAEAQRWLEKALELALEIEDATCRATAGILLSRVQALSGELEASEATLTEHAPEALEDPELEMARQVAMCNLALSKCLAGQGCEPAPAWELPRGEVACLNACVEEFCLRLELCVAQGDGEAARGVAEVLRERAGTATDSHLRDYAEWLVTLTQKPKDPSPAPFASEEETILALRSRRLLARLSEAAD
ncbi:MAG: adenylate/guanylate cyclase domain-containing protein [Armatimonadia bacterium]